MTSLAAGPPLLLSELGQYLIESLSIRAEGGVGGGIGAQHLQTPAW